LGAEVRMYRGAKYFYRRFAAVSLGFAFLATSLLPRPLIAATTNTSVKRGAASSQFARAEELRALLNSKAPDQRTLAEYKKVVAGYQRVYLITPHASEVPEALLAVAELNCEMGDRFGRSYYQTAADSYGFLIREYPAGKHAQDAMLRLANLQKDQLGIPMPQLRPIKNSRKNIRGQHINAQCRKLWPNWQCERARKRAR